MVTRLNHAASWILKVRGLASVPNDFCSQRTYYRYFDLHFLIVLDSVTTVPCCTPPNQTSTTDECFSTFEICFQFRHAKTFLLSIFSIKKTCLILE
jgi:hypothetical protein